MLKLVSECLPVSTLFLALWLVLLTQSGSALSVSGGGGQYHALCIMSCSCQQTVFMLSCAREILLWESEGEVRPVYGRHCLAEGVRA